jgi:ribosomal protein S18 acetylase RimI-like enzyme
MVDQIRLVRDAWLSEVFKYDTFRLSMNNPSDIKEQHLNQCFRDVLRNKQVFIYTKIPTDDVTCVHLLEDKGFRLIDTNIALERPINSRELVNNDTTVRFAHANDEAQVRNVAGHSMKFSRFHLDPTIATEIANGLKETWAGNYFHGKRGNEMVVSERDGQIASFLQILFSGDILVIDLIAVSEEFRRKGIASNMIACAEANLEGFNRIRVGTQIANIPSLRLYERLGFRIINTSYILHYHSK